MVLPTYNVADYLRPAIESVFQQTYGNWELIVVDDGSTDGTPAFLDRLTDPRIRVLRQRHCGLPARLRNKGLATAQGDYVAFLDSDDIWCPDKLDIQLSALREHSECGWTYCLATRIDDGGEEIRTNSCAPAHPLKGWIVRELMTLEAVVATPTVLVRRDLLMAVGGFDETFSFCEDYDLWIRLAIASQVTIVPNTLAQVRNHQGSYTFGRFEVGESWVQLYEKLAVMLQDPTLRTLARGRRTASLIHLAHRYRWGGRYRQSLAAIWRSAPRGMAAVGWWSALLKGLIRSLLPGKSVRSP